MSRFIFVAITSMVTIAILYFVSSTVFTEMENAVASSNATGEQVQLLASATDFFPVGMIVVIAITALTVLVNILNPDGLNEEKTEVEEVKEEKPHKQTYKEYVEERLAVERMMS